MHKELSSHTEGTSVGSSRKQLCFGFAPPPLRLDPGTREPAISVCFYSAWSEEPDMGWGLSGSPEEGAPGLYDFLCAWSTGDIRVDAAE